MLLRSLDKMGCKRLISWQMGCREGVSQLNDGGCSFKNGQKCHIHSPESACSINQNCQRRMCTTAERHRFG